MRKEQRWNEDLQRKPEHVGEKPASMPLLPPLISLCHAGLNRVFAGRSRRGSDTVADSNGVTDAVQLLRAAACSNTVDERPLDLSAIVGICR